MKELTRKNKNDVNIKSWFYWEFSEIPPISLKDIRSFQRFCSGLVKKMDFMIKNALRSFNSFGFYDALRKN
jgi:hypothetical protein